MVRQPVRKMALEIGLSLVDQTKLVTAASELARNTLIHGGGGRCTVERWNREAARVCGSSSKIRAGHSRHRSWR